MNQMKSAVMAASAVAFAVGISQAAAAASIMPGTLSSSFNFVPTVATTSGRGTFSASDGATFETSGSGQFANAVNGTGTLNGTLSFGETQGVSISQSLASFFTFSDGNGGNYVFDVASVRTADYLSSNLDVSGALSVLGNVYDSYLNLSASPAAFTISFNSTGGSAFSGSGSLATTVAAAVPEPATWSMMILGMGAIGFAMRRRHSVRTRLTYVV